MDKSETCITELFSPQYFINHVLINDLNTNKLNESSGELKKIDKKFQLRVKIFFFSKSLIFLICFGDEPQHAPIILGDFFI